MSITFEQICKNYIYENGNSTNNTIIKSTEWFNDLKEKLKSGKVEEMKKSNTSFMPGSIYIFDYNPKHKDTLAYFDKKPIVLSLGKHYLKNNKYLEIGINLTFLPLPYRYKIMSKIYNVYKYKLEQQTNKVLDKQTYIPNFNYELVAKQILKDTANFAIRTYIPNRKTNIFKINYENWKEIMFIDLKSLYKINSGQINKLYKGYLNDLKK
jgi:hypothetical protein